MKIAFFCHDLNENNIRLQPWRYIYELSYGLSRIYKFDVIIMNNTDNNNIWKLDKITIINIKKVKYCNPYKILVHEVKRQKIDLLIFSITPSSIVNIYPIIKLKNVRKLSLITCPLYNLREILKIANKLEIKIWRQFFIQALVPKSIFQMILKISSEKVIVQSNANKKILNRILTKVHLVPVGISKSSYDNISICPDIADKCKILYLGSPYKIRGIYTLINSVRNLIKKGYKVELTILSRTKSKENSIIINEKISSVKEIILIEGILDAETIKSYIQNSHIIAMPFLLVPSDVPIAILEAMQFGKPVISTSLDGIPELIENRGFSCKPGSENDIQSSIIDLITNKYNQFSKNALTYMKTYPTWDVSVSKLNDLIQNV